MMAAAPPCRRAAIHRCWWSNSPLNMANTFGSTWCHRPARRLQRTRDRLTPGGAELCAGDESALRRPDPFESPVPAVPLSRRMLPDPAGTRHPVPASVDDPFVIIWPIWPSQGPESGWR